MRQAALNDADRLFKLHAGAQRARRDEAGQRAERLPVQPGALLAAAQPLQVGLQLCNEPVLAILTCQQNMCKALRKDEYNLCPNFTAKLQSLYAVCSTPCEKSFMWPAQTWIIMSLT